MSTYISHLAFLCCLKITVNNLDHQRTLKTFNRSDSFCRTADNRLDPTSEFRLVDKHKCYRENMCRRQFTEYTGNQCVASDKMIHTLICAIPANRSVSREHVKYLNASSRPSLSSG